MTTHSGRRLADRRGAALVETALTLVIFLTMLFGFMELGRVMMTRHVVMNAARHAARVASTSADSKTTEDIEQEVAESMSAVNLGQVEVSVYEADENGTSVGAWKDAAFGQGVAVRIDTSMRPFLPTFGIVPDPIPLSAISIHRSEAD